MTTPKPEVSSKEATAMEFIVRFQQPVAARTSSQRDDRSNSNADRERREA
jgi:hypothetical protein